MKARDTEKRLYRQGARADAAEDTAKRIMDAFYTLFGARWYDEVTLDAVARDAGVTVQTVIRRYGGKEGLLDATVERMSQEIKARRLPDPGDLVAAVEAVVEDYEQVGDFVLRMLAQEGRFGALQKLLEVGRTEHRSWVGAVCAPLVEGSAQRREILDGVVIATDVYTWKLLRRDMGRSVKATKAMMLRLVRGVIEHKGKDQDR